MSDITIDTPDGPMTAALGAPAGEPRGGVVVVQEAFGLTPHIVDLTRRLADAGWLAIAPAIFHRQGSPVLGYDELDKIGPVFQQLHATELATDIDATVAELDRRGIPARRTGIVGFCLGGTISFVTATRLPLGAAVTFYGGGVAQGRVGIPPLLDIATDLQVPWLGLYGDRDKGIPVEDVEALRERTAEAGVPTEIVRYADADHGFNCNDRASYHPPSAADAWARTLAWFDTHLA